MQRFKAYINLINKINNIMFAMKEGSQRSKIYIYQWVKSRKTDVKLIYFHDPFL